MAKKTTKKTEENKASEALDNIQIEIRGLDFSNYDRAKLESELKKAIAEKTGGRKYEDNVYVTASVYLPLTPEIMSMNKKYVEMFERGDIGPKYESVKKAMKHAIKLATDLTLAPGYDFLSQEISKYHKGNETLLMLSISPGLIIN